MEALFRYISAIPLSILALFSPITPLVICVVIFIAIDFVTGVWASRRVALKEGKSWYFESEEAWRTLYKLGFSLMAIMMAWLLESYVIDFVDIKLARLFAGFVCGVEMWSFLENASQISDAPYFEWMRKYVHRRVKKDMEDAE
ncbi:MAG: phage holin family protein [Rikenellaceae bacterium]